MGAFFSGVYDLLMGPDSRLWPVYLLVTIVIAFAIYRVRRVEQSFISWLLPKSVYFHASHIVDLKVFVVNRMFAAAGIVGYLFSSVALAQMVMNGLGGPSHLPPFHPVVIALLLLVTADFGTYWVHRVHHESRILWPFHALHHSAEVMTPITVFRRHPVYDLIATFTKGVLIGILQGVLMALFGQAPGFAALFGINAGYALFNIAGANLRHTHVWLSFGRWAEHIVISPAQHQVHHSLDPRHHNKNYGEILALWDWIFGTLYVPQGQEQLEFGLADSKGNRLRQRHDSLTNAMLVPLKDSGRQIARLAGRISGSPPAPAERPAQETQPAEK
ncbi:sterol desaturase family protein [Sinisalibacter aestuarii]|uniref:Sterol desaturase n=1 Tax=Sinisalibacter aestuarii TaxID=2949426 RepID=A0ABQ5LX29_9RHOB|nr:sterol desaturase family protein [Sinisalibacter aestuarii]GKY89323.1 sterol desaturase [Sinisalibacter aestuarii]